MGAVKHGTDNDATNTNGGTMNNTATIATFGSYHTGEFSSHSVERISAQITGRGGSWSFHLVFVLSADTFGPLNDNRGPGVSSGRHVRIASDRTYRTKALALAAIRGRCCDHFTVVPAEATFVVNRAETRRPLAVAA